MHRAVAPWRAIPEVGSAWGLRFVELTVRLFGRRVAGAVLWVVCWYFVVTAGVARRASADFWARLGRPTGWVGVHRHFTTFARAALDRLHFLSGQTRGLTVELHGHELVMDLVRRKRGALLVGAHLGSFEALRCLAGAYDAPMTVLVDFTNAQRINALLRAYSPGVRVRSLQLDEADPTALFEVKAAVDRGELVALLADRATGRPERDVWVPFLGAPARFPVGAWVLAHLLECPVYFVSALLTGPSRYDVHCLPLFDRVQLPRARRAEALREAAGAYAAQLEAQVRAWPLNWFNFYPFWDAP